VTVAAIAPAALHPAWCWFDVSQTCNLSCLLCYTKASHAPRYMRARDFSNFFAKLAESKTITLQEITLNWRGEPLTNPEFPDIVREASALTVRYGLSPPDWHTNGTLITAKMARTLVDSAAYQKIWVSIDGGNRVAHERNRGPGSYAAAVGGLRSLLRARGRTRRPFIGVYQIDVGLPHAEYDPELIALASSADEWRRKRPVQQERPPLVSISPRPLGPCFWAGHSFCISPNGDVSICLLSNSADGIIGNLATEGAGAILERSRMLRAQMSGSGRASVAHCRTCRKPPGDARVPADVEEMECART
jgi:sulfatase maturation enzyme AslB (radical SAM superfamily)